MKNKRMLSQNVVAILLVFGTICFCRNVEKNSKVKAHDNTCKKDACKIIIEDSDYNLCSEDDGFVIRLDILSCFVDYMKPANNYDEFDNWMENGGKNDFIGLVYYTNVYTHDDVCIYEFLYEKNEHITELNFPWYVKEINNISDYESTFRTWHYSESSYLGYTTFDLGNTWPDDFSESFTNKSTYKINIYSEYDKMEEEPIEDYLDTPSKEDVVKVSTNIYTITAVASGSGTVNITESPSDLESNEYYNNQRITLTASEENFDYWEKNGVKLDPKKYGTSFSAYATEDATYTAHYKSTGLTAEQFATDFNESIGGTCNVDEDGIVHTVIADLKTAWSSQATSFSKLSDVDKNILAGAPGEITDPTNVIYIFAYKYDYVYEKYWRELAQSGGDFAGRYVSEERKAKLTSIELYFLDSTNGNNTPILVAIITILCSTLSIGGYFLIKRKREE